MFGLIVLVVMGLYLLIAVGVVHKSIAYARANGKSAKRWGWGAALGMYLLVFWDWIPTVATHQYYCATEAGFWVYKTPEQWKKENPGAMEDLVSYNKNPGGFNVDWPSEHKQRNNGHQKEITEHINKRFDGMVSWEDVSSILPITRRENIFLDVKNNEVIARYIDFGSGNSVKNTVEPPEPLKFWMHNESCLGGKEKQTKFGNFYIQFKGTEK
jgi:hypothetical protein